MDIHENADVHKPVAKSVDAGSPGRCLVFHRRWRQFSLRSLLIALTMFSLALGIFMHRVRRQEQAVAEIKMLDGLDARLTYESNWLGHVLPQRIEKLLDDDICANVVSIQLMYRTINRRMVTPTHTQLRRAAHVISRLPHVNQLELHTLALKDEDLATLAPLGSKVENLTINELFHHTFRGNQLAHLGGWSRLRRLEILSSGLNETLNLGPLASLTRLTHLSIGPALLNERAFADISSIKTLASIRLFQCGFDGEHFEHLRRLPSLNTITLHNISAETEYERYVRDGAGDLKPRGQPSFRFVPFSDFPSDQRMHSAPKTHQQWLNEVLPNVQVLEFSSS